MSSGATVRTDLKGKNESRPVRQPDAFHFTSRKVGHKTKKAKAKATEGKARRHTSEDKSPGQSRQDEKKTRAHKYNKAIP